MANSQYQNESPLQGTTRKPAGLRRLKSRLPISTVFPDEALSKRKPTNTVEIKPRMINDQKQLAVEVPSSRTTSGHMSDPTATKSALNTRHTRPAAGSLSISTTTMPDTHKQHTRPKPSLTSSRTPSLVSGSTRSTAYSLTSSLPKNTTSEKYTAYSISHSDSAQKPDIVRLPAQKSRDEDPFPEAIFGMSLPATTRKVENRHPEVRNEVAQLQEPATVSGREPYPQGRYSAPRVPTPSVASSSRYSESPFSHISTPTSASSYSSGMAPMVRWESISKSDYSVNIWSASAGQTSATHNEPEKEKPTPTIPPELAHLNVEPSISIRSPPRRPSRDGTMDITDQQTNSSIVHSNLPAMHSPIQRRVSSAEPSVSAKSPSGSSRGFFGFSSRSSSRQASPRTDSVIVSSPSLRPSTPKGPQGLPHENTSDVRRQDSPMVGFPTSPTRSARFSFLTKRPKEISEIREKPERTRKRGPAAGTGHEGYGRMGLRGRSSSIFGGSFSRSSSADSSKSTWTPSFFSRRGSMSNDDESQSNNLVRGRSGQRSHDETEKPKLPAPAEAKTAERRRVHSDDHEAAPATRNDGNGALPASSSSMKPNAKPDLHATGSNAGVLPNTPKAPKINRLGSPLIAEGREGHWLRPSKSGPRPKTTSPSNFAQRLSAENAQNQEAYRQSPTSHASARRLTHYALDGVNPSVSLNDVQELADMQMREPPRRPKGPAIEPGQVAPCVPYERRHESLMPFPPPGNQKLSRDSSSVPQKIHSQIIVSDLPQLPKMHTVTSERMPPATDVQSPPAVLRAHQNSSPRLTPIGRIPQVVSSRSQDHIAPDQATPLTKLPSQPRLPLDYNQLMTAMNANFSLRSLQERASAELRLEARLRDSTDVEPYLILQGRDSSEIFGREGFLEFPSRDSELSYTSSSERDSASGVDVRRGWPTNDSWSEYNGLSQDRLASISTRASSQDTDMRDGGMEKSRAANVSSRSKESVRDATAHKTQDGSKRKSGLHLSSSTGDSVTTPTTPFSISDYLAEGDRTSKASTLARSSVLTLGRETIAKAGRSDLAAKSGHLSLPQTGSRDPEALRNELSDSRGTIPSGGGQAGTIPTRGEFRHAALVTSKWLSFGRVLFSPVHEEAQSGGDARVLILDGLGKGKAKLYV